MKRTRGAIALLPACAAIFGAGAASAQPHKEPHVARESVIPVTEPAAIAEWLRRLVGKFRFDGMMSMGDCADAPSAEGGPPPPPSQNCQGVKGQSDCVAIGDGPGVQCILNVTWQDVYTTDFSTGQSTPLLVSYLDPAMHLLGIDPRHSAVNQLLVDNKGLPEGGRGTINGNVATFRSPCVNQPAGCYHVLRIEAKPEARLLYWWLIDDYDTEPPVTRGVFSLRRVAKDEEVALQKAIR